MKEHIWITNSRNNRISAMLHQQHTEERVPIIIMCHGFTADKVGTNKFNQYIAESLFEEGYHILRFDFIGSGDSEGNFTDVTTLSGWIEDLENVIEWVNNQDCFVNNPIFLLGHSLGGCALLLQKTSIEISGRILLSPVVYPKNNFKEIIFGFDEWSKSINGEIISGFLNKNFHLGPNFVNDLENNNYDIFPNAKKFSTPTLIIHGGDDLIVPVNGSIKLYNELECEKQVEILEGCNHVYTNFESAVKSKILVWFQQKSINNAIF